MCRVSTDPTATAGRSGLNWKKFSLSTRRVSQYPRAARERPAERATSSPANPPPRMRSRFFAIDLRISSVPGGRKPGGPHRVPEGALQRRKQELEARCQEPRGLGARAGEEQGVRHFPEHEARRERREREERRAVQHAPKRLRELRVRGRRR